MKPGTSCNRETRTRKSGFTLVELLAVIAIVGLLLAVLLPGIRQGIEAGRRATCASNLRQVQAATLLYLRDHNGRPFPYFEDLPEGRLWYWGLEAGGPSSGAEGR
ncbi:MAG: type II secretion system protein, partial [Kiritimatiellia bacterium]|nr:type II secretion system protein [Kiritimatiellia bacterium]